MRATQNVLYNIVLDEMEVSELVTEIEEVYAEFAKQDKLQHAETLSKLKDAIVLAANKS